MEENINEMKREIANKDKIENENIKLKQEKLCLEKEN
jgi:hypothetical protein